MATKKTNVTHSTNDDLRVTVDRVELAALRDLQNLHEGCVLERAKVTNRNHDLAACCEAQAKRLIEVDLILQHYERVNGIQRAFIDLLRGDRPQVASLEDLSTFWQHWSTTTQNHTSKNPQQREEVAKLEPDLFRSWRIWVRDAGKTTRSFAVAGTRAEVEAHNAIPQATLQDHIIENLRTKVASLIARESELEAEVAAYKSQRKGKAP